MNVNYPNCECSNTKNQIIRVNNGDSFKITYRFIYETMNLMPINLNFFDFSIRYYTLGNEDKYIEFNKPSISSDTCRVDSLRGILTFIFLDYVLPNGNLYGKYTFRLPSTPGYGYASIEEYTKFTGVSLI